MIEVEFNWDKHFASSSFRDIQKLSPELTSRRHPSSFSPDGSLFYVSSLDDYCGTSSVDELQSLLKQLGSMFHALPATDYQRRYLAHSDFEQVCLMLYGLGEDDRNYGIPDEVLEVTGATPLASTQA